MKNDMAVKFKGALIPQNGKNTKHKVESLELKSIMSPNKAEESTQQSMF